ncbi:hypothetical protein D3C73_1056800 [compost metagenome]
MQQVVERRTRGHVAIVLLVPVAEHFGLTAGEQVVAPAFFVIAPVARLVDQLLGAGGDLAVFDQAHFHFIDATR